MSKLSEGMTYKWIDVSGCSFQELHDILSQHELEGWELERITGPEQMPETALYGQAGALQLWLQRGDRRGRPQAA
jgi:hypothetical protein